ncbi:MAG: pyridoxal phosphate-dependent aminotransferase [Clostridiales bacterium]|nr:pyridoxal phosphate-dependent aminotransferase [Clostridiales bacterium]
MKYDFDKAVNRRNTYSLKWDVKENELPMWVADMDFETAPEVKEALQKRVEIGAFGYSIVPVRWYKAIEGWWMRRYGFEIKDEWLQFCTGTLAAVSCAVKRITNVGDNVVLLTPVYNIFFNSVENHGRRVLESRLVYKDGSYSIDFEDLEKKLSNYITTMLILCNPHNPTGNIWSKEDLAKIGELCQKYNVTVLSDEVHCDLTELGSKYIPFASVSETCKNISITCISAAKSFNLAGLQSAAVCIPNEALRNKMIRGLNSDEVAKPNFFAVEGVIAAYEKGEEWLEELRKYIAENKKTAADFIKAELPEITAVKGKATYLMWLDCRKITENTTELCRFIRKETGLILSEGEAYRGNGKSFLRLNTACPKSSLTDGLLRLKTGINKFKNI